jgi:hypothetical protein
MSRHGKSNSRSNSLRSFENSGKTPIKTIRPTLKAFEMSNDIDVITNMYKTELYPFILEYSRLRRIALKEGLVWNYNPVPMLEYNRFWQARLNQ